MGEIRTVQAVKLFCGILGAEEAVIDEAVARLAVLYGLIDAESEWIPFRFTDYYRAEMGERLLRKFVAFAALIDPDRLADIKRQTNQLESDLSVVREGTACRRVNLDPGYVSPSKVVLASTKDFSHRIYLRDGIYAEVTLNFRKDGCRFFEWTYPDFQSEAYTAFLLGLRAGPMGTNA